MIKSSWYAFFTLWVLRDQELVRERALPQMSHSYDTLLSLELCHASWRKHHKYRISWSKVWHLLAVLLDLCLFITAYCRTVRTNDTVANRYKTWIIHLQSWFLNTIWGFAGLYSTEHWFQTIFFQFGNNFNLIIDNS